MVIANVKLVQNSDIWPKIESFVSIQNHLSLFDTKNSHYSRYEPLLKICFTTYIIVSQHAHVTIR